MALGQLREPERVPVHLLDRRPSLLVGRRLAEGRASGMVLGEERPELLRHGGPLLGPTRGRQPRDAEREGKDSAWNSVEGSHDGLR
jgi:hypothetical protein